MSDAIDKLLLILPPKNKSLILDVQWRLSMNDVGQTKSSCELLLLVLQPQAGGAVLSEKFVMSRSDLVMEL